MVTGGAICSTAGAIAPPVNMLDEALSAPVLPKDQAAKGGRSISFRDLSCFAALPMAMEPQDHDQPCHVPHSQGPCEWVDHDLEDLWVKL